MVTGTMIDRVMVESCPDASHVLAISEFRSRKEERSSFHIGVCAAECAAGSLSSARITSYRETATKKRCRVYEQRCAN